MPEPSPLSDAQAQRLIKLYTEAEAEILGEVNRLLMGPPKDYSLAWQRTILQRVQQIKGDLLKGSRTWCQEAIPASYMQGTAWADKDPLSGKEVQAGFGSVHQQAVEVLADNAYSRLENVVHVVGRRVDDIYRNAALEASRGAVVGYKTTRQAALQIRKDLADKGITGFVDKAGHSWNMRRYAKVLAQETTNTAFRQGTINRLEEKGHDLVRISSHAGSCPLCTPHQGQTFSLTGQDKEYPALSSAKGLFHVGCLHVISLAPEEKDRFIGRTQGAEGEAARAAEIKRLAEKAGWKDKGQDGERRLKALRKELRKLNTQSSKVWKAIDANDGEPGPLFDKLHKQAREIREARTPLKKEYDALVEQVANSKKKTELVDMSQWGMKGQKVKVTFEGEKYEVYHAIDSEYAKRSMASIWDTMDQLHPTLKRTINTVLIEDERNPADKFWEKEYNMPGFRSAATGGGGRITLYQQAELDMHVAAHEAGHNLDQSIAIDNKAFWSESKEWKDAFDLDGGKGVSSYARSSNSIVEDFADSASGYVADAKAFKKEYPHRAEILKRLIG